MMLTEEGGDGGGDGLLIGQRTHGLVPSLLLPSMQEPPSELTTHGLA